MQFLQLDQFVGIEQLFGCFDKSVLSCLPVTCISWQRGEAGKDGGWVERVSLRCNTADSRTATSLVLSYPEIRPWKEPFMSRRQSRVKNIPLFQYTLNACRALNNSTVQPTKTGHSRCIFVCSEVLMLSPGRRQGRHWYVCQMRGRANSTREPGKGITSNLKAYCSIKELVYM